jgi:hypothetical protein
VALPALKCRLAVICRWILKVWRGELFKLYKAMFTIKKRPAYSTYAPKCVSKESFDYIWQAKENFRTWMALRSWRRKLTRRCRLQISCVSMTWPMRYSRRCMLNLKRIFQCKSMFNVD